ncbi:unnamed protein product [Lampetra planeri]
MAPKKDVGADASSSPRADDGWRHVAEQLDFLRTVLLQLLMLSTAAITAAERPSAITTVVDATWREAAIFGAAAGAQSDPAISPELRGALPGGTKPPEAAERGAAIVSPTSKNSSQAATGVLLHGGSSRHSVLCGGRRRRLWLLCLPFSRTCR